MSEINSVINTEAIVTHISQNFGVFGHYCG